MRLLQKIELFKRMDDMIQHKSTGSPIAFAKRLGICESTMYNHLKELKELGAPIKYDKSRLSYYYKTQTTFICEFRFEVSSDDG